MLKNIYNQKITILNKLKREDSLTGLDVWHKTVIEDAAWYSQAERGVSGTSVVIGSFIKVLIPFHNNFLEYRDWKESGKQEENFTMSIGDYIVLGEVNEDVTAQNVVKVMQNYEPNTCQIKHFEVTHNRFGAKVQLQIEGV